MFQAKKEAKLALAQHGLIKGVDTRSVTFKMPSSDQLSRKRVDPLELEVLSLYLCRTLTHTVTHMQCTRLTLNKFREAGSRQEKDVQGRKVGVGESWKRG